MTARPIGVATMLLGAGRARVDSSINPAVGVILHKKMGDEVREGDRLCTILADDEGPAFSQARDMIESAYVLGDGPIDVPDLIVERL